ncbi:MAG: O-methyltransferase [Candidatus Zixiibacteriota bacterium]|nr:MAG: O-methyltransferase [candidate division Zixibacteria bacterium]
MQSFEITDPRINEYIKNIGKSSDPVLKEMEKYAVENHFPIIGPMVGPFLRQLAIITNAKNILELGSGFGYSAYWFAGGIPDDGRIICTDSDESNRKRALEYLKRGGFERKIDFRLGDALEIASNLEGPFDIIMNDIDKHGYPKAFDPAVRLLKPGGIFITDNVLWSGRVLSEKSDENTKGIQEFNRRLFNSDGILSSIIPIRDGLGLAVKL